MTAIRNWQIRVKALMEGGSEQEFQVVTQPEETIGAFRLKLADKSNVEPQKQRLIFCGRVLSSDTAKLVDVGLSDGSALHMVTRPAVSASSTSASGATNNGSERTSQRADDHATHNIGNMPFSSLMEQALFAMRGPMPSGVTLQFEIGQPILLGPLAPPQQQQQQPQPQREQQQQQRSDTNDTVPDSQRQEANRVRQLIDEQVRMLHQSRDQHMQAMRSSASSVLRDFGRDDGGQWVAMVPERGYIPIDYEATSGTQLTEEELARESVPFVDGSPRFVAPPESAYAPIPGLSRIEGPGSRNGISNHRMAGLPSRALANELVYNLLGRILPEIRRLPGQQSFEYSSPAPEYISQSTADPVGAAGAGLTGLGDAFVEIGRALQTVGGQWQNADTVSSEAAYSPDNMMSLVQAVSEAVSAVSVAIPFLRSTPVQLAQSRTVSWQDGSDRESESTNDSFQEFRERDGGISRRARYLVASTSQRSYRRLAQSLLMLNNTRLPEGRSPQNDARMSAIEPMLRSMQAGFSTSDIPFDRLLVPGGVSSHGDSLMRRWQRQWQRRLGQQQRSTRQRQSQRQRSSQNNAASGDTSSPRESVDINPNTNTNANTGTGTSTSTGPDSSITASSNSNNSASLNDLASNLEARISQLLRGNSAGFSGNNPIHIEVEAISMPGVGFQILNNTGSSNQTNAPGPAEARSQGNDRQQTDASGRTHGRGDILSSSDASEAQSTDMPRPVSPENNVFTFIDRAGAVGSQTARSDRSNFSTTTEYSTNNGPSTRIPRILNFGAGGIGGGQMPGFGLLSNPFPLASVFLGTESSSASTTRRTSISSNPGRPAGSDEASSGVADANGTNSIDSTLTQSQSLTSQQQVGATRPRSVSFLNVNHGDDYEAGAANENSSYIRGSRGSSKRHKTRSGENSENEDNDEHVNASGGSSSSSSSRGI
ncbi:hypothetical protein FB645_002396 [Coemansia sp. IMI 203386]|nr:hypothetical protein FB645_002396 [Coemansia sp. IMI 203386]